MLSGQKAEACAQAHLINLKTGKVLGANED